ncbi:MAG: helix-turn-helix transcriptional regulator [Ignavibacteria bacterium]
MEKQKIIGKNIAFFRKLNNMTQESLSEYLGINRAELSYYETGERKTPLDILNKLSDLFQVELIDLLEMYEEDRKERAALSFRADELSKEGYKAIGEFGKVVKNYLKMKRIEKRQ